MITHAKSRFIILNLMFALFTVSLIAQDQPKAVIGGETLTTQKDIYTHPGILFKKDEVWVGTDYLYNVPKQMGLIVEVIVPSTENLKVSINDLSAKIIETFRKYGIEAQLSVPPGPSGLPFFNVLIMIYPVEKGEVALVDGRLFEQVILPRVALGKDTTIQAITWEKKTLIKSSKEDFQDFLSSAVLDVINSYGDRFKVYDRLKQTNEG